MTVNRILTDLGFSTDFKVRDQALETLTRRIKEAAVSTRQALARSRSLLIRTRMPSSSHLLARSAWLRLRSGEDTDDHQPSAARCPAGLNPARTLCHFR